MARILMVATALATTNLSGGRIVHTDPNSKDPRARFPFVDSDEDVARLETAEVAKLATKAQIDEANKAFAATADVTVDQTAAARVESVQEAEQSVSGTTGLDTRATLLKQGGADPVDGDSGPEAEEVEEDIDEAPAGGRKAKK